MTKIITSNTKVKIGLLVIILAILGLFAYYFGNNKPSAAGVTKEISIEYSIKYDESIENDMIEANTYISNNVYDNNSQADSATPGGLKVATLGQGGGEGFASYGMLRNYNTNNPTKRIVNPYTRIKADLSNGSKTKIVIGITSSDEVFRFKDGSLGLKQDKTLIELIKDIDLTKANPIINIGTFEIVKGTVNQSPGGLICQVSVLQAMPFTPITFTAVNGSGSYSWTGDLGTTPAPNTDTYTTLYESAGVKKIKVTNGKDTVGCPEINIMGRYNGMVVDEQEQPVPDVSVSFWKNNTKITSVNSTDIVEGNIVTFLPVGDYTAKMDSNQYNRIRDAYIIPTGVETFTMGSQGYFSKGQFVMKKK